MLIMVSGLAVWAVVATVALVAVLADNYVPDTSSGLAVVATEENEPSEPGAYYFRDNYSGQVVVVQTTQFRERYSMYDEYSLEDGLFTRYLTIAGVEAGCGRISVDFTMESELSRCLLNNLPFLHSYGYRGSSTVSMNLMAPVNNSTGLEDVRFEFERANYVQGFKWAFNYRAQNDCTGSTSIFEDLIGPSQYFTVILHGCKPDPFVVYEDEPGDGNSEVRP